MAFAQHTLDIYGAEVWLATTKREWKKVTHRCDWLEGVEPGASGRTDFALWKPNGLGFSQPVVVLWLDVADFACIADLVETIAHEAKHAADYLLDHVGHERTPGEADEPGAYLAGWFAKWMWGHCQPWIDQQAG